MTDLNAFVTLLFIFLVAGYLLFGVTLAVIATFMTNKVDDRITQFLSSWWIRIGLVFIWPLMFVAFVAGFLTVFNEVFRKDECSGSGPPKAGV